MGSDERKLGAMMYFQEEKGLEGAVAGRSVLAMMPLDDAVRPGRAFEKAARKLSKQFAKSAKRADGGEIDRLATETLQQIRTLAVEHGEEYYAQRYDQALSM
jgi:hypothetical protein